jgi:hypothetical protein
MASLPLGSISPSLPQNSGSGFSSYRSYFHGNVAPDTVQVSTSGGNNIELNSICSLFSFQNILQNFSDFPSHQILRHMHGALNIDKTNN